MHVGSCRSVKVRVGCVQGLCRCNACVGCVQVHAAYPRMEQVLHAPCPRMEQVRV